MTPSELDSIPETDVPLWCLLYADHLSDRGVPDAGWRALGVLGRYPEHFLEVAYMWWMREWSKKALYAVIGREWYSKCLPYYPSRSSAMQAAADAFLTLDAGTQREILGNVLGSVP